MMYNIWIKETNEIKLVRTLDRAKQLCQGNWLKGKMKNKEGKEVFLWYVSDLHGAEGHSKKAIIWKPDSDEFIHTAWLIPVQAFH